MAKKDSGLSDLEVIDELRLLVLVYGELSLIPAELLEPAATRFSGALQKLKG